MFEPALIETDTGIADLQFGYQTGDGVVHLDESTGRSSAESVLAIRLVTAASGGLSPPESGSTLQKTSVPDERPCSVMTTDDVGASTNSTMSSTSHADRSR